MRSAMNKRQFKKLKVKLNKTFRKNLDEVEDIFRKRLDREIDDKVIKQVEARFLNRLDAIIAERIALLHK
jgi:hypothetical protein